MFVCPECKTSYDPSRLGVGHLITKPTIRISVDVKCSVCGTEFSSTLEKETTPAAPRSWRTLWRQRPEQVEQVVKSFARPSTTVIPTDVKE